MLRRPSLDSTRLAAFSPVFTRLSELALGEVVGVAGAGVDGEAAFGEPGQRADQVGGHAGDQPGAEQHRVDVPVGVVVGEDRAPHVVLVAGRRQVAGGGEDRVDRVVGILAAVLVGVGAVHPPGRRDELHPADRAGGGDVQVAAVVGLDLVDRRQHLPADPVLDPRRLVDRQQKRRHPELADDEIRHPGRRRRTRQHVHEARVRAASASRPTCAASALAARGESLARASAFLSRASAILLTPSARPLDLHRRCRCAPGGRRRWSAAPARAARPGLVSVAGGLGGRRPPALAGPARPGCSGARRPAAPRLGRRGGLRGGASGRVAGAGSAVARGAGPATAPGPSRSAPPRGS